MNGSFREQCIALRKQDKSIIEIMKITGSPKTSIYQHIRNIPLSARRMRAYRAAAGLQVRQFAVARKGKSVRPFMPFDIWTTDTVLLLGHLLFDGEIARGRCAYNNRSVALVNRVERLMKKIYDFDPKRYTNSLTGVTRTAYFNVALGAYLQTKSNALLVCIGMLPPKLKLEFLRAFFDDEGCMDFRPEKNHRKIRGYQKDVRVLKIIQRLLFDLGILSEIKKPNEVVITGKENLLKFEKKINFSKGLFINGNRSNSRWKKHIEKRELLRQAIASFKN